MFTWMPCGAAKKWPVHTIGGSGEHAKETLGRYDLLPSRVTPGTDPRFHSPKVLVYSLQAAFSRILSLENCFSVFFSYVVSVGSYACFYLYISIYQSWSKANELLAPPSAD